MIVLLILACPFACIAAISIHAARAEIAEEIEGARIAKWLSQYHYPSNMFRGQ